MADSVNKALIENYLNGACTPAERELVEQFLQQPEGKAMLDEILTARLPADIHATAGSEVDAERMEKWKAAMNTRMETLQPSKKKMKRLSLFRHAAVWAAVMFGIGYYAFYYTGRPRGNKAQTILVKKENPLGQRAMIRLTDGSAVLLGAGSKLTYPERFDGSTREVTLEGEAFFEISNNPAQPFIVRTGNVQTQVLGTSFRISAFNGFPLTVAVATGKVRVDQREGGKLTAMAVLTPGLQLTWDPATNITATDKVNVADVNGWKNARLAFNNKTLKEVAAELERWYNVKIIFRHQQKAAESVTVTLFAGASLEKTLEILAAGSNFRYTINKGQIIIH